MAICKDNNCKSRASFGYNNEQKYCSQHKEKDMTNNRMTKCGFSGCNKGPSYGIKKATHCLEHKSDEMYHLNSKKCEISGCNITAGFGILSATRCNKHKTEEMGRFISKNKMCDEPGCNTFASYGSEKRTHCGQHKTEEMFYIDKSKICKMCNKFASYGIEKVFYCFDHKQENMIDLRHYRCTEVNCEINASFGYKEYKPLKCVQHKKDDMLDVHKRCSNCLNYRVNSKYKFCNFCDPEKDIEIIRKEIVIKNLLNENNYKFTHNNQFPNDCKLKVRPDFLFQCSGYFLILEVDEFAHSSYEKHCEIKRMNDIILGLGLPTKFIRYNPDKVKINQQIKHDTLLKCLNEWLHRSLDDFDIETIYLFY
jgi:EsV-1-7 cysteine-rich motif